MEAFFFRCPFLIFLFLFGRPIPTLAEVNGYVPRIRFEGNLPVKLGFQLNFIIFIEHIANTWLYMSAHGAMFDLAGL
jgi:hypothetical protein